MKKSKRPKPIRHPNFIAAEKILNLLIVFPSARDQQKVLGYVEKILGQSACCMEGQTSNDVIYLKRLEDRFCAAKGINVENGETE